MQFVNDLNIALAWKVEVCEVTDETKNHELTGEWGVYASFSHINNVLVAKFDWKKDAVFFKNKIQKCNYTDSNYRKEVG